MKRVVGSLILALVIVVLWFIRSQGQQQIERVRVDDKSATIRKNSLNWVEVLGEVINETTSTIGFVGININLKDTSGKLLDVGSTYVNGKTVSVGSTLTDTGMFPGERASFKTSFSQVKFEDVKTIEYVVTYRLAGPRTDVPDSSSIKKLTQIDSRLTILDGTIGRLVTRADSLSRDVALHTASIRALGLSINIIGTQLDSLKARSGTSSRLLGDLNNDGGVDFDDFFLFAQNFGKKI